MMISPASTGRRRIAWYTLSRCCGVSAWGTHKESGQGGEMKEKGGREVEKRRGTV